MPRIGAIRSADNGQTWEDLGIVLDAPPGSEACDSGNRFVLGGVGDVTAALDADGQDVYLYFSQYSRDGATQGVAVARLAWADRDQPVGQGGDLERRRLAAGVENAAIDGGWAYPAGTPLVSSEPAVSRSLGDQRRLLGRRRFTGTRISSST